MSEDTEEYGSMKCHGAEQKAVNGGRYTMNGCKKSISRKLISNTGYNIAGRIWNTLVTLALTPYIINHIGLQRYGVWALVGTLTGYFGLLDFGFGTAFVKHIAEFAARREHVKISRVVNTGFIFYSFFAMLVIGMGAYFIDSLVELLNVPPALHDEARFVFLLGIIAFGVYNAFSPFGALQAGLQRMDVTNKLAIAMTGPQIIGTILALEAGAGIRGLMTVNAMVVLLNVTANFLLAFRLLPDLSFTPRSFSGEMFGTLFRFGFKIQVTTIAGWVQGQLDRVLLALFLGMGPVAFYAIAASLAAKAREIPLMLTSAILPAASEIDASMDKAILKKLYLRSMKYMVLTLLPVSGLTIIFAFPFVRLWLGSNFDTSARTVQILMLGFFLVTLTAPGNAILNGMGRPQYAMRGALIAIPIFLLSSVILLSTIGYFGVAIGAAISLTIGSSYFLHCAHRTLDIRLADILRGILMKPLLVLLLVSSAVLVLVHPVRQWTWFLLAGAVMVFLLLAFVLSRAFNLWDDLDRTLVDQYNPIQRRRRPEKTTGSQ
jgi:O-antigen/teichoic acid export membrane protein